MGASTDGFANGIDPSASTDEGAGAAMGGAAGFGTSAPAPGADGAAVGSGEGSAESDAGLDRAPIAPGQLTAGEWSDLDNWEFWRGLHVSDTQCNDLANCIDDAVGTVHASHWGYDTAGRVSVRVRYGSDPVVDAVVTLSDESQDAVWTAHTDNQGRAELFAGLFAESSGGLALSVAAGGESVELQDVEVGASEVVEVDFPVAHVPAPSLDLMFVIDTTGSMGDELQYIQAELENVIERVRDEIGSQLAVRLSVNFYRDHGDAYVVRDFQFTTDVEQALGQLSDQSADGGGDTPEALEQALDNGVNEHTWSDEATARLLFFVLDAPPHHDTGRLASLHASTRAAAEKGIQIVPLAASGVDESTEFLLRLLALSTNGTYTFLTDDSGIGNSHLEPTIGDYEVELLDDLMVRVIREAL